MGSKRHVVAALGAGLTCLVGSAVRPSIARADTPSPLDPNVISQYGEVETPRSAAMGGALRALGTGTTGLYMNPASLASVGGYHIDASTQAGIETKRWLIGVGIADSITSRLAGAFSIQGTPIAMDPSGIARSTLDVRVGLAFPITDRFIIGLNGRYLNAKQSGEAAPSYGFCQSVVSGGLIDFTSGTSPQTNSKCTNAVPGTADRFAAVNIPTFDAGLLIKPTDSLAIALVGQNLTYANNGFLPMIVAGGIGYANDAFAIEVDGLADFSSWTIPGGPRATARIMGGAEYKAAGVIPIRAGYRYDEGAKLSTLSVGTGYVGTEFAVEASGSRSISNPGVTSVFFSASYFLESSGVTKGSAVSSQVAQ